MEQGSAGRGDMQLAARLRRLPEVEVLGLRVRAAIDPLSRLLGLAGLREELAGAGLLLPRCRSIHTLGMRFPIDVAFLGQDGCPVSVSRRVSPGRFVSDRRAVAVLEVPSRGTPNDR